MYIEAFKEYFGLAGLSSVEPSFCQAVGAASDSCFTEFEVDPYSLNKIGGVFATYASAAFASGLMGHVFDSRSVARATAISVVLLDQTGLYDVIKPRLNSLWCGENGEFSSGTLIETSVKVIGSCVFADLARSTIIRMKNNAMKQCMLKAVDSLDSAADTLKADTTSLTDEEKVKKRKETEEKIAAQELNAARTIEALNTENAKYYLAVNHKFWAVKYLSDSLISTASQPYFLSLLLIFGNSTKKIEDLQNEDLKFSEVLKESLLSSQGVVKFSEEILEKALEKAAAKGILDPEVTCTKEEFTAALRELYKHNIFENEAEALSSPQQGDCPIQ